MRGHNGYFYGAIRKLSVLLLLIWTTEKMMPGATQEMYVDDAVVVRATFLAPLDKVQEELLYYPRHWR